MTNEKETKDINTNTENKGENSASSSSTNITISEQEKAETRTSFLDFLVEDIREYSRGEITAEELLECKISFQEITEQTFTFAEQSEIFREACRIAEKKEKRLEAEATAGNSAEIINEQPQELSEAGKKIIKIVNEAVSSSNQASRSSGKKVEDIFTTDRKGLFAKVKSNLSGSEEKEIRESNNELY